MLVFLLTLTFCFLVFFAEKLFMPKLLRPFLNQISNLVLIRFKENKILMLTVGSRKILKIVIEIQFKFAMTIFFSGFFVFFSFLSG